MFKPKRILVPVDFSAQSELALEWAVMLSKEDPASSIELIHVLPNLIVGGGPETMGFDYLSLYEEEEKAVTKRLKEFQDRIPEKIASFYTVSRGDIAYEIEQLCKKKAIDLVIMTTHGRKGLSHLLHGSTTEETARLAPCPVLVLHLNEITREALDVTASKSQ